MMNMFTVAASRGAAMAMYQYRQAVTFSSPQREVFEIAASAANETVTWYQALNQLYDLQPPSPHLNAEEHDAYMNRLEQKLFDAITLVRDPTFIYNHNVRYRLDTDPVLTSKLKLDLTTAPDIKTLERLMSAKDTSGQLIENKRYTRDPLGALDAEWSAGKSVSVAFSLATPAEKLRILEVHRNAVDVGMRRLEQSVASVRRGHGGFKGWEKGHITWVAFDHTQSRAGDPHLHTHVLVLGTVQSQSSDRLGSLFTLKLPYQRPALRRSYQMALTEGLRRIGIDAWFDEARIEARIRGIPDNVLDEFSQRKARAIEQAKEFVQQKGQDWDALSPRQQSALTDSAAKRTRSEKHKVGDPEEWRRRAQATGWEIPTLFTTLTPTRYHTQHEELEWDDRVPRLSW